jgi:hypothetical protein
LKHLAGYCFSYSQKLRSLEVPRSVRVIGEHSNQHLSNSRRLVQFLRSPTLDTTFLSFRLRY